MMWELKQIYNGYRVEQYNVIIDVLGGYSKHLEKSVRKLLGARARSVLERMQKSVISNTLNIARTFNEHELFPPSPPPLSPSLLVYSAFRVVLLTTAITRVLLLVLSLTVAPSASTTLTIKLILPLHRNTCLCILCPECVFIKAGLENKRLHRSFLTLSRAGKTKAVTASQ